jgi:hypothetical protein
VGLLSPSFIIFYVLIFYNAKKNSSKAQKKQQSNSANVEMRLAIMGCILTSLYLIMCGSYVCILIFGTNDIFSWVFGIASDLLSVSNPYLLLLFSSTVRAQFVAFLTCRQAEITFVSTKVVSTKQPTVIKY